MNQTHSWTTEQRYQRLEAISAQSIAQMNAKRAQDDGFPSYHIAPKFGLLNDPNGLCYFNGAHHIFYQWTPVGPVHGLKYWRHVSTTDYVNFIDHGVAIAPGDDYDSHGAYSGSALVLDEEVKLFFTGNKRDQDWLRTPTQCVASMDAENAIHKQGVIIENQDYTEHFRDPKVWHQDGQYWMVIGAQTPKKQGKMALYHSHDLDNWTHKGAIETDYDDLGYMWECPDFFELDGKAVMLFSPQGVKTTHPYYYKNIYSVTYLIGDSLNFETPRLENHQAIAEPDLGFDFYAPQTYQDAKGRRILIAWIGLPDIDTPSIEHQWAGMLSLPRQLNVKDGYLIQTPLAELSALRKEKQRVQGEHKLTSTSFYLSFELEAEDFELALLNQKGERIVLRADAANFELDRSEMTYLYAQEYGCTRQAPRLESKQTVEIYVDKSVIEIFLNQGKHTMTSRFFIDGLDRLTLNGLAEASLYDLNPITGLV